MVENGGIATIGQRARASITNPSNVIWVSTEYHSLNSTKARKNRPIRKPFSKAQVNCENSDTGRKKTTYLDMKLQCLCLITCHMTSSCCIFNHTLEIFGNSVIKRLVSWRVRFRDFESMGAG